MTRQEEVILRHFNAEDILLLDDAGTDEMVTEYIFRAPAFEIGNIQFRSPSDGAHPSLRASQNLD